MATTRSHVGDGDPCPVDTGHGPMLVIRGTRTQYCPDAIHDGAPKTAPSGARPATRAFWPTGIDSFKRAVDTWRTLDGSGGLPTLDIEL